MKLKRVLSCLLVVVMLFVALPLTLIVAQEHSTDVNEEIIQISTLAEFQEFAIRVNNGETELNAKLIADIDCNGNSLTAIGNVQSKYSGTFDGAGYTISNFGIESSNNNQGLFGYCSQATIKNLNVNGIKIVGAAYVGGIVGYADNSIIENCTNNTEVCANGNQSGGIVGYSDNSMIVLCTNSGKISGTQYRKGWYCWSCRKFND